MSKFFRIMILVCGLLAFTGQSAYAICNAGATEVYISPLGNDDNNGTSAATAVKSTAVIGDKFPNRDICLVTYNEANVEVSRAMAKFAPTGVPLPTPVLYTLLVGLALLLILVGRWLQTKGTAQLVTVTK